MHDIRLQKFLAEAGIASRRKAEELIIKGRVRVNGISVSELGTKVSEGDFVELDGKRVNPESQKVYIMLNKPVGYVTTAKDQFARSTVLDLLKGVKERVYPVGRLDYDTSGLILLTNDGDFTFRLTHPRHEVNKVYIAEVNGIPNEEEMSRFEKGLKIEDYITAPAGIRLLHRKPKFSVLEIEIHEGRNRQVRKMCDAIGHPVNSLQRVAIGSLKLGDLEEGAWRYLTSGEVNSLLY